MSLENLGAVSDVSVLASRENLEFARRSFGGHLYLPAPTYAWLSRDKLISVRRKAVSYTLVGKYVRDGKIYVVYLPELHDEIARRLLFEADHRVPLTDLRAILLGSHMHLPVLAFDDGLVDVIKGNLPVKELWQVEFQMGWPALINLLRFYRKFQFEVGEHVYRWIENGGGNCRGESQLGDRGQRKINEVVGGVVSTANNGSFRFRCLMLDFRPIVEEYLREGVLQRNIARELCRLMLSLLATPSGPLQGNTPSE